LYVLFLSYLVSSFLLVVVALPFFFFVHFLALR
jgi:hypothetical protein